jgi:hypothetical protein
MDLMKLAPLIDPCGTRGGALGLTAEPGGAAAFVGRRASTASCEPFKGDAGPSGKSSSSSLQVNGYIKRWSDGSIVQGQ